MEKLLAVVSPTAVDRKDNLPDRIRGGLSVGSDRDVDLLVSGDRAEIDAAIRASASDGADRIVAIGGDGTVAAVASALAGGSLPLAIVPVGSGNVLAEALGIPLDREEALQMARDGGDVRFIDAMRVNGRVAVVNAGVGISSLTVRDVPHGAKLVFGRVAYVMTGVVKTMSSGASKFRVEIDGRERSLKAIEVSVVNAALTKEKPVFLFPDIHPDDGELDVLVVWAPSVPDFLRKVAEATLGQATLERNVQWSRAQIRVVIDTDRELPVQADGDVVGTTPATIDVLPGAVGVIVPPGR